MKPGNHPGGMHAFDAGDVIDPVPDEESTPSHGSELALFPNAVDRTMSVTKVGNTVAVILGDYAPESLAFLFAWDPLAEKEIYIRSGRRSELEAQARANNREGRDYFVLPRNQSEKTVFTRIDDSASFAPSSAFGSGPDSRPAQTRAPGLPGGPDHTLNVFVVVPRAREANEPFRLEKNLDGRHWTSKAEAEGVLAVFEHQNPDVAGAMSVRSAKLRYSS